MKKFILFVLLIFFISFHLFSQQTKEQRFIPPVQSIDTSLKNSNNVFKCQVLQLKAQTGQSRVMVVLVETAANNSSRTKLRCNYLLKRERIYLKNVFMSDVQVLENYASIVDINSVLKKIKEKYDDVQLWSILNADTFFNTALQRSGTPYASHR